MALFVDGELHASFTSHYGKVRQATVPGAVHVSRLKQPLDAIEINLTVCTTASSLSFLEERFDASSRGLVPL